MMLLMSAMTAIFVISLTGAMGKNTCTDPRGRLAWKALVSTDKGHMLYTGFNASVYVCTYISTISKDSSTMSITGYFIYQINDLPVVYTDIAVTKVENCEGLLGTYNKTSGEKEAESTILYTNFDTCTIFFNHYQQACQLWAYENATNSDIQRCLRRYKKLCEGTIYEVYNSTCLT
ncbi:uncharacterized protein LOC115313425 [Ixodes scapularis]|uniref:uncharacterized protein LOC115313425 n=1 Tax=Ixodes scapularis TaxID=6945 RepID=UPI001A9E4B14|nr:uncharacterized protein LOC115313425 [Ixodes scapularis]